MLNHNLTKFEKSEVFASHNIDEIHNAFAVMIYHRTINTNENKGAIC